MTMRDRVLGCLLGGAIGDAMGAATEMRTTEQIEELFGGLVTTFETPPDDTFARGNLPGQVTDDFSVAYFAINEALEHNGKVTEENAKTALLKWGDVPELFSRFAGPTTRAAINAMRTGETLEDKWGFPLCVENDKATNGAAMKAGPIACLSLGDIDLAFDNCMVTSMLTHDNNTALSSAAAVSCAVARALQGDAGMEEVLQAALEGAKRGDEFGRKHANILSNPDVYKKTKLAIALAAGTSSMEELMKEMADVIGTSVFAYESIPAAFGFISKCMDNPMEPIIAAVNAGNDTDSVAIIVGSVVGAMYGANAFPKEYLEIINERNGYNLEELTDRILALREE